MKLLQKDNWWIWVLLLIGTQGTSGLLLGALTDVFKKGTWYSKIRSWLIPIAICVGLCALALFSNYDMIKELLEEEGTLFSTNGFWIWAIALGYAAFLGFSATFAVFFVQISAQTAAKLQVPGKEIYLSMYLWIILLIIPFLGWALLLVMIFYIVIWPIVMLKRGAGEQYLQ